MNARCPWTADVIARHLDGDVDVDAGTWRSAEAMADHLRDCAHCQRELQRSRRLDATLAEASGRATGDLEAEPQRLDHLLQRALAVAVPPTPAQPPVAAAPGHRGWRLLVYAGLVLLGFALAALALPRRPAPPADEAPDVPRPATEPAAESATGHRVAPAVSVPAPTAPPAGRGFAQLRWSPNAVFAFAPPRTRTEVQRLAAVLGDRAFAERQRIFDGARRALLGLPAPAALARAAAERLQLAGSQALLDAATAEAFAAWTAAAARLDSGQLLDAVLADARKRPALTAWLRQQLTAAAGRSGDLAELGCLTTAARLGGRELDAALQRLLRRAPALQQELVAALRLPGGRSGRAALLLDVANDLVARGRAADEGQLLRALFAGQPPDAAIELQQELRTSRQEPRRVRCLLALGALGTADARPPLLAALGSASLTEALAAAFALAQLPRAQLADLLDEARRPGAWLLRAALCCAGLPDAERWLEGLDLSAAERRLLATGGFTFAQFPVFASLLRERPAASF